MRVKAELLDCDFDNVSFQDVIETMDKHIQSREPGFMVSLNTDIAIHINKDPLFKEAYSEADLALLDSQPLLKLLQKQGIEVKEKLSGSDLMPLICEYAANRRYKCFILGGAEGVPEQAACNLRSKYDDLCIGCYSPKYGFEKDGEEIARVIKVVNENAPDIMFICLGAPKSEKFLHQYISDLNVPFTFSVGAAVDFAAENVKRAPLWMQKAGLEWFYRFTREPKRLFKRYFIDSFQLLPILWRNR